MRVVLKFVRRIFTSTKALIIIALLVINVLTVTSFKMFDIASSLVRMAVVPVISLFDEKAARNRPTWGEAVARSDELDTKTRTQGIEIDDLETRNLKIEQDLELSTKRNKSLEFDLSQTKSRHVTELNEVKLRHSKQTSSLVSNNSQLTDGLENTKTRHANEVAGLITENRRLNSKIAGQVPTASNKAVRKEVRERTRRLMTRISRSTALEIGSAPAELASIGPGALVSFGLLVYEIRDTCLQMSELKELYNLVSFFGDEEKPETNEMDNICGLSAEDLKAFIFSKTPQEACHDLRAEMQQVNVPGCEDFPVQNSDFEIPDLSDAVSTGLTEDKSKFALPELD